MGGGELIMKLRATVSKAEFNSTKSKDADYREGQEAQKSAGLLG